MPPRDAAPGQLSGTLLIHGDRATGAEVAPSISVTTSFRDVLGGGSNELDAMDPDRHVYSRYSQSVSSRVDQVLGKINHGHAITYASGLAAAFSALVHFKPKRIAISGGYMGSHNTIRVYLRGRSEETPVIDLDDEYQEGDLCWLETPVNPTGESRDIQYYANKVHAVGGKLFVDSTFGPPPLQYPFKFGADYIFHRSKYFGGHCDLLCGILIVKTAEEREELWNDRTYMGNVMGSLESWLLFRSLRTMHLRIPRQSASGTAIAQWLHKATLVPQDHEFDSIPGGVVTKVWHSSLQGTDQRGFNPKSQMEGGYNAAFSILFARRNQADAFPYNLEYFVPATSLGGVESLVEQRIKADPKENPLLVRLSIGVEEAEERCELYDTFTTEMLICIQDLKDDLRRALQAVANV